MISRTLLANVPGRRQHPPVTVAAETRKWGRDGCTGMQGADEIIASKMGDTLPDYVHMDREIQRSVDHMTYLPKRYPTAQNDILYRATRLIF